MLAVDFLLTSEGTCHGQGRHRKGNQEQASKRGRPDSSTHPPRPGRTVQEGNAELASAKGGRIQDHPLGVSHHSGAGHTGGSAQSNRPCK